LWAAVPRPPHLHESRGSGPSYHVQGCRWLTLFGSREKTMKPPALHHGGKHYIWRPISSPAHKTFLSQACQGEQAATLSHSALCFYTGHPASLLCLFVSDRASMYPRLALNSRSSGCWDYRHEALYLFVLFLLL
jgi:hypothetical protein